MLTKADKVWIKETLVEAVQNELKALVFNEIEFEELAKDERSGKMVKTGKKRTEKVNLLQFMAERHYGIEGAWRGYQADVDRMKAQMNRTNELHGKQLQILDMCGNALASIAHAASIGRIMIETPDGHMGQLEVADTGDIKEIEGGNNGADSRKG